MSRLAAVVIHCRDPVPVRAGFPAIEAAMTGWEATVPAAEWSFGNVE